MDIDELVTYFNLSGVRSNARVVRILCVYHHENTASLVMWRESRRFLCHGCGRQGTVAELEAFLAADPLRPVRPVYTEHQLSLFPDIWPF